MMLTATITAWADVEVEVDGLRFSVSTGTVPVTAKVIAPAEGVYTGEITIPSSINYNGEDIIVDFINSDAFANATITKVTIPSTVYFIGARAFYHCENLSEITLPEGLREISVSVFAGCPFTSLTLPGTLTRIGSYGLEGLSSLQKLTFAYSEEKLSMDWSVFNGTNNIIELVIDRDYSFGNNTSISKNTVKKVTFGEHVTKIPEYACYDMTLEELNMGANVTAIGKSAFMGCTLPEGYNFPFAQIKEIEEGAFYVCKNLPANIDLTGVEKIGANAFRNSDVQIVKLGSNLTTFGECVFQSCDKLTTLNIPGTINSLESWWFYGCNALTNVTFDYGSTALTLEDGTFGNATTLTIDRTISGTTPFGTSVVTKVALGSHMDSSAALSGLNLSQYTSLNEIELLKGVITIPDNAFQNLSTVTTAILPSTLKKIGNSAFSGCANLTIPGNLPEGLEEIGNDAFKECAKLEVTLPSTLTRIGEYAFYKTAIKTVNIPSGVTKLEGRTFMYSAVETATIPGSITEVDRYDFSDCENLKTVTIENGATPLTFYDTFDYCENVETMNIDRNFTIHTSTSNPLIKKVKHVTFGNHVTAIPRNGFYGSTLEQAITFPSSLKEIGYQAFHNCSVPAITLNEGLEKIDDRAFYNCTATFNGLPSTLTSIGQSAFSGCTGFTGDLVIPAGVTVLSMSTFYGTGITSVTIPGTVTKINQSDFGHCANLKTVTLISGEAPLNIGKRCFYNSDNITDVTIDRDFTYYNDLEKNRSPFNTAVERVTFGSNVTRVGDRALASCMNLSDVVLPDNITTIGIEAFKWAKPQTLTLSKNLTTVEDYGFYGMVGFASLTLPISLNEVGQETFYNITNLKGVYVPWIDAPIALTKDTQSAKTFSYAADQTLWIPGGTLEKYQAADGWKRFQNIDFWSFMVTTDVKGKGTMKLMNGEKVTDNGTNTSLSITSTALATEPATETVRGLFAREKDLIIAGQPARGYEMKTVTANDADLTVAKDTAIVSNLLADQAIHVTFAPINYKVTCNLAGGTLAEGEENPETYTVEDAAITLKNPTRTGYTFEGWTGTDIEGTAMEVTIAANSIGDRSFVATWKPVVYTITYQLNKGKLAEGEQNPNTYTIESSDFTLVNPTRTGYTFTGWEGTDLTEKTIEVTVTTGHWGNRSYTATWEPNPYKVKFVANGGEGTMEDQDFLFDTAQNLTANAFTRTGYFYANWNSKADGTGTAYEDKQEVKNLASKRDKVVKLYAQWTPITYSVTFNANNGEGEMAGMTFTYDEAQTLTASAFTRTGYTFDGWNTKADGSGNAYTDKQSVKNLSATQDATVTLYAQWKATVYNITYNLDGGTLPEGMSNPETYTIEDADITLVNPERKGYSFLGWTGTDVAEASTTVTIATGSIGDREFTATWLMLRDPADVNADDHVDVADIASIIDVMSGAEKDPTAVSNADVNHDGQVDVADIASVISRMAALARQQRM